MDDAAIRNLDAFLQRIPYARFLGVRVELAGDEMTAVLPFADHLVGNPVLPALHGGVIGAFLEMTALAPRAGHLCPGRAPQGRPPGGQRPGRGLAGKPRPARGRHDRPLPAAILEHVLIRWNR